MSLILLILGGILCLVGGIWLIVVAFQESVLWGVLSLLIPGASLIFVIMHWEDAKKPFLINIGGVVLVVLAGMMAPHTTHVGA